MSKGLKPIIITAAVILVVAVAMVLMIYVFPESGASQAAEPNPTETPAPVNVKIVEEDASKLVSFEALPADGESMLVELGRNSDGDISYTVTPETKYFDYDQSKFRSMIYTLTSVSATNFVEENAQDLAIYGLDKPQFTMRCTYEGGRVLDLCVGKTTPTDSNFYVKTNESNDVYTLGSYVVSLLMRTDLDYRQITLFPTYTDDAIYSNINYVKMTLRDGSVIELQMEDVKNPRDENVTGSAFFMLQPVLSSCNDTVVQTKVLDSVAQLTNSGVLADISEDEYGDYGFDNPAMLDMTDVSGNSVSILVGHQSESGYYYVMLEKSPETVIMCPAEAFAWLDVNYIELINRVIWYENIVDVDNIVYKLDGVEYVVEMQHFTTEDEDGTTKKSLTATLNGNEISEQNARRLFVRTLNFRIIGDVPSDAVPGEGQYSLTINRLDGSSRTLELSMLNDRQFACTLDGETKFYVYKKNVTTLLEAFETVLDGRDLPMSFDS